MQGTAIALVIELEQILGTDPADIAQDMTQGLAVGVVSCQLRIDNNTGQLV